MRYATRTQKQWYTILTGGQNVFNKIDSAQKYRIIEKGRARP